MNNVIRRPTQTELDLFTTEMPEGLPVGTGLGISNKAADNLVPFIAILHFLSPQVEERDTRYIPGARPGMFWLQNHPDVQLIDGDEGIIWQQCYVYTDWKEWVPREVGGGFRGNFPDINGIPDHPTATKNPHDRFSYITPEGNNVVQFRNHLGYVLGLGPPAPYILPYKSTGLAVSRSWMTQMPRQRADGSLADSCDFLWRLKTKFTQNQKGKWYYASPSQRLGYAKPNQVEMGHELAQQFESRQLQAATTLDADNESQPTSGQSADF